MIETLIADYFLREWRMNDSASVERYQAKLNRAIDYVMRNLDRDLSLTQLAEVAHFSPFHFHRVFQASVGETVAEFVIRARFDRAILLMRSKKEKALTDIALECGFRSMSNFSRAFKKRFLISPAKANLEQLIQGSHPAKRVGGESMQCALINQSVRVEKRPSLRFFYKRVTGSYLKPSLLIEAYQRIDSWADAAGLA
jgi:AraC family transcriptional regulator